MLWWAIANRLSVGVSVQLTAFYLQRRSVQKVTVAITADKQFLHGAGPSFDRRYNSAPSGVTLKLEGAVLTRAYVMGQMLKNIFSNAVACTFKFAAGPGPTEWKVQQLACPSAYIRPSDDWYNLDCSESVIANSLYLLVFLVTAGCGERGTDICVVLNFRFLFMHRCIF